MVPWSPSVNISSPSAALVTTQFKYGSLSTTTDDNSKAVSSALKRFCYNPHLDSDFN